MKKILILVDKVGPKKELFAEEIAKRVGKDKQIVLGRFSDLYFEIDGKNVSVEIEGIPLADFSLVYFRRAGEKFSVIAATLAVCLKKLGVKFIDSAWSDIGPLGSKFTSYVRLSLASIPVFPTIYVWQTKINEYRERIIKRFGLPIVAKELSTQGGRGVFKINSKEDFKNLPIADSEGGDNQFMFQKFIKIDKEYRLLVLGDRVRVWEEKVIMTKGEFRHNIALGAEEKFLPIESIPQELSEIAIRGAKALNLEIAGVDIITEAKTGKIYIIEINRGPGVTYDTSVSPELSEIAKFLNNES